MILTLVIRKVDNVIHRMNHYPADSVVCFVDTYLLDSDSSGEQCYPAFEKPGPVVQQGLLNFELTAMNDFSPFLALPLDNQFLKIYLENIFLKGFRQSRQLA